MTNITGKDKTAEETIEYFSKTLAELGLELEFTQILNPVPNLYSVILQDKNIPYIQTNGKGTTLEAAKASAYGEMAERYLNQSFFEDFYLGKDISEGEVVRYPDEVWVPYHENIAQFLLYQASNLVLSCSFHKLFFFSYNCQSISQRQNDFFDPIVFCYEIR